MKTMNILTKAAFFTALLILLFGVANESRAAAYTVDTTADNAALTACTSAPNDCSLRGAIASANSTATNDVIDFALPSNDVGCTPGGVCTITLSNGDLTTSSASTAGTLTITNSTGAANLLISGNNLSRVFFVARAGNLMLNGVTVTNGNSTNGGGIFNDVGTLTVVNCIISDNSATFGAGIVNRGENGTATLTINNSTVSGNSAVGEGGGIENKGYNGGAVVTINSSTVSGNSAINGGGINSGAVDGPGLSGTASVTINDSLINRNSASTNGGGISNSIGLLTVNRSTITGNTAFGGLASSGGGIYSTSLNLLPATVIIDSSTFDGNSALSGGGIYNATTPNANASLTISNSTFSNNSASGAGVSAAGAIYNDGRNSGNATLTISNSTFSNNSAPDGSVGAIYNDGSDSGNATLTITANTFSGNSARFIGGGIYNRVFGFGRARLTIGNTIMKTGARGENLVNDPSAGVVSRGYNLFNDNGGGFIVDTTDQINTDPLLGPLQDNGGPTLTFALLPGSLAIDKGKSFDLMTDQRGMTRPVDNVSISNATGGDGADIGAFEVQSPTRAGVSVSGRVVTADGRGIARARISLTDSHGQTRTSATNPFGYFRFDAVVIGEVYVFTVSSKSYSFIPQVVSINEEMSELNFVAYSKKSREIR